MPEEPRSKTPVKKSLSRTSIHAHQSSSTILGGSRSRSHLTSSRTNIDHHSHGPSRSPSLHRTGQREAEYKNKAETMSKQHGSVSHASDRSHVTDTIQRRGSQSTYRHHAQLKKGRRVSHVPPVHDTTIPLYLHILESNTIDIWLHKKGGDFDIFDGKLVVQPANFNPKKDYITVKRIPAIERHSYVPELDRLEKVNGDIYAFSTNRKQLKAPVQVWIPCTPITHPMLQEIKLKAKYKDEEEWVYHDWKLFGDDPTFPIMEFVADRLGTFVATVQPRVERVTVTDQGLLYNARINRYISLRFPKKCVEQDTNISIRIIPFNMEKAMKVREEFRMEYPDLSDFELATDYFEITAEPNVTFKRAASFKLPTPDEGFNEEYKDGIIILRKDLETNQWSVIESHVKFTKTTMAFESKILGKFIIAKAPAKRKMRLKNALPILETKMALCRREILIFKKLDKKSWNIWVELVRPSLVHAVINKREEDGLVCIAKPEHINVDLDGQAQYEIPMKHSISAASHVTPRSTLSQLSELDTGMDDQWHSLRNTTSELHTTESEEHLTLMSYRSKKKLSIKRVVTCVELADATVAGTIAVEGDLQPIEGSNLNLFFMENLLDNYSTFEIEPKEATEDQDISGTIKFFTENISTTDGLVTKSMMKEVTFTITAEQVRDYFWVEPEPEPAPKPVVDVPLAEERPIVNVKSRDLQRPSVTHQMDAAVYSRLTTSTKAKQTIYREPRVLSGRSLQTLSRQVEEGLTLAVYLEIPDSTITGIGFDALANGLSLADVTYKILLRWKRCTKAKGSGAVEELANALRGMGRLDVVSIIWECHAKNCEMTPESFSAATGDDDEDTFN